MKIRGHMTSFLLLASSLVVSLFSVGCVSWLLFLQVNQARKVWRVLPSLRSIHRATNADIILCELFSCIRSSADKHSLCARVTLQEITTDFWQSTPAVITSHVVLSCSNPHRVFYASCHALRSTVYKCGFLPVYCVNCFYVMLLWWLISFSDLLCCLCLRTNLLLLSRHILSVFWCGFQVYL